MLFTLKTSAKLVIGLLGLALCLSGCGARQPDTVQLQVLKPAEMDTGGEDLNAGEVAALKTTGQIDRHVPKTAMPEVAAQYKYFLRKGRDSMCSFSKRSEQYLAYARKVFKERGMPEELANLAIVESGYRANAVSRAGAAGAWQFMPATGKIYGLNQDWWQDDRLDPYKATEAAAAYLQKLYNDFGDWPTAIAAYNAGEGKLLRAKASAGAKDFYEVTALNHTLDEKTKLREETMQYVPRFMAVTKIMRNLPELGFEPINPDHAEPVTRLVAAPGTDLKSLSQAANLNWDEFRGMNQHHKRMITCTERETFVYVPAKVRELAKNYLCSAQNARYVGWRPVKITNSRDSLEKISKRANISLATLQGANPGVSKLVSGQVILAPAAISSAMLAQNTSGTIAKRNVAPTQTKHVFGPKDTLYAVAKKYNVPVNELKAHNAIQDAQKIRAGMVLSIPTAKLTAEKTVKPLPAKNAAMAQAGSSGKLGGKKPVYKVKEKDSLWSIAKRHNISVEELRRINSLENNNLKPGLTLIVASE